MLRSSLLSLALLLAACQEGERPRAGESSPAAAERGTATAPAAAPSATPTGSTGGEGAYAGIAADETVQFVGTEPFWGGEIKAGEARYSTPENQDGTRFPVRYFAGNNGVGYSGTLDGTAWDMTITPGTCSDGMSDRSYPFTATLTIGSEQRSGCAWTARQGFTGPENP